MHRLELSGALVTSLCSFIHSFIQFILDRYFYNTSSSPLLLRGAPDYSIDNLSELARISVQTTESEGLAQGPYLAARVGFEPGTLLTQGTEPTTSMSMAKNSVHG